MERRRVALSDGTSRSYSRLLIATGSAPIALDVPGRQLENVLTLRGLDDARRLRERLLATDRVVVIGAGLIGLEVAAAARLLGKQVAVIERGARPLERLLGGHEVADAVHALHASHGVELRTGATVAGYEGGNAVERVRLTDGSVLDAGLVVVAIGIRPSTEWLSGSGLALHDGILVDTHGETNVPGVFAAGDVARVVLPNGESARLESYGHAHTQGVAVGRTLAGVPAEYASLPAASSEQFGARLQIVGRLRRHQAFVVRGDRASGSFSAFAIEDERVTGAFAMNRPRDVPIARRLIESRERVRVADLATDAR